MKRTEDQEKHYGMGNLRGMYLVIEWIENEIKRIKDAPLEPNTPRQISNSGKLLAYNKILCRAKGRIQNLKQFESKAIAEGKENDKPSVARMLNSSNEPDQQTQ